MTDEALCLPEHGTLLVATSDGLLHCAECNAVVGKWVSGGKDEWNGESE
jgi:hypothetical protein